MLGILGSVIGQVVNNILVGKILGVAALSVTGITLPIHYIFATLGAMFGIGGMTVCAHLIGGSKRHELREAFTQVYVLTVVTGVVIAAAMLLNLDGVVAWLGAGAELAEDVKTYARVMIVCGVFNMGIYPAFHLLRLDGRTWMAVVVFAVMAAVTVALDILLLVVLKMGLLGAAIAYGGGLASASLLGAFLLFFKSRNFKLVRLDKRAWNITPEILKTGSPSAMENLCILLRVYLLNLIILGGFGIAALSAFNVTNTLMSFAFIFVAGVSGSIMPFAGVLHVEKDIASIRQLLRIAFVWGLLMIVAFSMACIAAAVPISALFGMAGETEKTVPAIITFAIGLIPFMANSILICLYQSTGRPLEANMLTALRGVVIAVAAAWALSRQFGIMGVWQSFWISDALTLAVALAWAAYARHKNRMLSRLTLLDETAEKEGKYIALSVRADSVAIAKSAEQVQDFCEQNGISAKRAMAIALSLEEFLRMIAEKNTKDPDIAVRLLVLHDVAVLRIRDTGMIFDPVGYYEENRDAEDVLGIKLALGMAETVDYRQTFGANNLTIIL